MRGARFDGNDFLPAAAAAGAVAAVVDRPIANPPLPLIEVADGQVALTRAATPYGLHYAPDPSSQAACTIGGNVAENAGGPHCLKYGVTLNHVKGRTIPSRRNAATTVARR